MPFQNKVYINYNCFDLSSVICIFHNKIKIKVFILLKFDTQKYTIIKKYETTDPVYHWYKKGFKKRV